MTASIVLIVAAYLAGSVASAIIVCRMLALPDPREGGSGNPGATNVLRLGSKKAAVLTLAGDVAKGLVPVLVANLMGLAPWVTGTCAIAAFAGHLYPIFFGFKGGKGYATALGVIAGLSTTTFVAVGLTWLAVAGIWRYSSLAALASIALAPVYAWFLTGHVEWTIATVAIAVFVFLRHKGNIERLMNGTESKIGRKT